MEKILFVCLGNICRSPMAEGLFKQKVKQAELEQSIFTYSAATSSWEAGNPPHHGTQKILREKNISTDGMRSTQITKEDFETYDLIIGMDDNNVKELKRIAPVTTHDKIHLFLSIVAGKETMEVPDPYYTGDFQQTFDLVDEGTNAWLEKVKERLT
ncbi:low molecular weight protein-tyrosine-phosphatase [Enterococcus rivorum]|uniref:protein-tyrosine-phosphatase n=1 Tax=Enterococcus rivorum TaxID=762845 RepID=A0A1E5KSB1_9ENTE|nr:low molecular weight protein-tyrosine-phosphatase [Enterococcus rivorum]MBP2097402.1 protein-tyrosine phosphatase [Enterococcus rivorum]OEH80751.1 protein-tyrosine-phosphatase [Enterococcus rivorum]